MEKESKSSLTPPIGIKEIQTLNGVVLSATMEFLARLRQPSATRLHPYLIKHRVAIALESLLPRRMIIPEAEAERWSKYYKDSYGIDCSFAGMEIPGEIEYPTRIIVMHDTVSSSPQRIAEVYKKRCKGRWSQHVSDLDAVMSHHDSKGTYALRVRDEVEASDGFENGKVLSMDQVRERMWITTTLPERLVDGDMYLHEKGEHLDQTVFTVCGGSHFHDGTFPAVCFVSDPDKVAVDYFHLTDQDPEIRVRQVTI